MSRPAILAVSVGAGGMEYDSGRVGEAGTNFLGTSDNQALELKVNNTRVLRLEPATGKVEWTGDLASRIKIESSPTGADDKIYFQNFRGASEDC